MLDNIPKISVLIVAYNQEGVISRTLDSLLAQRDYLYQICISDDCSKDNTWGIISRYARMYPDLFIINKNEKNLGIFENVEKTWGLPTGDIVSMMAGDDCVAEGWYKAVIEFIIKNGIDYKNEKFCIGGNYQCLYPSGDTITIKTNKNLKLNVPAIRLYERGMISGNRASLYSIKILREFELVSRGRSFIAENAQECQIYINAETYYYLDKLANVYYTGIGVSSNMTPERKEQHEQTMVYAFELLRKHNAPLTKRDQFLPYLNIAQKHMRWNPSFNNYIKLLYYKIKTFDFNLWLYSIDIKKTLFKIARRLPHKKTIHW